MNQRQQTIRRDVSGFGIHTDASTGFPIGDTGINVEPNAHFDDWDPTPHAYFNVGSAHVALGDVILGGTHQVEGFGRAEQRGMEARRFDLEYIVGPSMESTARLVIPIDQILEIKRYTPGVSWAWAYTKMSGPPTGDPAQDRAAVSPDYGSDSTRCGCQLDVDGTNVDGFELATTICDLCIGSWEIDYTVVRHRRMA